jgi:hypothetical protein
MLLSEQIINAVGYHGYWKLRLRDSIETGTGGFFVDQIINDNQCDFGKWLHSLSADEKNSSHWSNIQKLHAKFHIEAARLLELAAQGKQKEAENAISKGSSFAVLSCEITMAMVEWKISLTDTAT